MTGREIFPSASAYQVQPLVFFFCGRRYPGFEVSGKFLPLATANTEQQSCIDASAQKSKLYFYWVATLADGRESVKSREIGIRR